MLSKILIGLAVATALQVGKLQVETQTMGCEDLGDTEDECVGNCYFSSSRNKCEKKCSEQNNQGETTCKGHGTSCFYIEDTGHCVNAGPSECPPGSVPKPLEDGVHWTCEFHRETIQGMAECNDVVQAECDKRSAICWWDSVDNGKCKWQGPCVDQQTETDCEGLFDCTEPQDDGSCDVANQTSVCEWETFTGDDVNNCTQLYSEENCHPTAGGVGSCVKS